MQGERDVAQRELRNDVASVLREVEAGATLHVTVRGRHVADLVPPPSRRAHLDRASALRIVNETPLDSGFSAKLEAILGETIEGL